VQAILFFKLRRKDKQTVKILLIDTDGHGRQKCSLQATGNDGKKIKKRAKDKTITEAGKRANVK
jgi:hypothetical protein